MCALRHCLRSYIPYLTIGEAATDEKMRVIFLVRQNSNAGGEDLSLDQNLPRTWTTWRDWPFNQGIVKKRFYDSLLAIIFSHDRIVNRSMYTVHAGCTGAGHEILYVAKRLRACRMTSSHTREHATMDTHTHRHRHHPPLHTHIDIQYFSVNCQRHGTPIFQVMVRELIRKGKEKGEQKIYTLLKMQNLSCRGRSEGERKVSFLHMTVFVIL